MKTYTRDELVAFIGRAETEEMCNQAERFLDKLHMDPALREKLEICVMAQRDFIWQNSFYDDRDYGPSNPWDAPGMKVSDFIRGVSYC